MSHTPPPARNQVNLSRRDLVRLGLAGAGSLAATLALSRFVPALAEGGAVGTIGGHTSSSIYKQFYWFSVWFDEGGFVNGPGTATQGWETQSAQYFWNHFVAPECQRLTGQTPRSDDGSEEWNHKTPYQVYMEQAARALDLARARGGTKARVVGVGGFIMSTIYDFWQFATPTVVADYNMTFTTYFPHVPYATELKGSGWDADAAYAGANKGESWRDFIYRRSKNDLGGAEYSIIVIAVNDDEPGGAAYVNVGKYASA